MNPEAIAEIHQQVNREMSCCLQELEDLLERYDPYVLRLVMKEFIVKHSTELKGGSI